MLTVQIALKLTCNCGAATGVLLARKDQRAAAEVELRRAAARDGWATAPKRETCPACTRKAKVAPEAASA